MILKLILLLSAAFGLFWTIKTKKVFPAVITLGMIVGIIVTLFLSRALPLYGFYIYMGFVAMAFVYGLTLMNKKLRPGMVISLMSVFIFTYWLWVLNHWHGNELLLAYAVLLTGVVAIITKAKLRNEIGFLVVLGADAVAIILEHFMKNG